MIMMMMTMHGNGAAIADAIVVLGDTFDQCRNS